MNASDPRHLTAEEIQREVAQILAAGYLRLCEEARQGDGERPLTTAKRRPRGPGMRALRARENDLEVSPHASPDRDRTAGVPRRKELRPWQDHEEEGAGEAAAKAKKPAATKATPKRAAKPKAAAARRPRAPRSRATRASPPRAP